MSTKDTIIRLLSIPLDTTYRNQIDFVNIAAQEEYFNSRVVFSEYDCSYQREGYTLRVNQHIDNLWRCNYVMYNNNNFEGKWFYGFITKKTYVNDGCTFLEFEIDAWQTWQFDIQIRESFVEREHIITDGIGANIIEESLDMGEYEIVDSIPLTEMHEMWAVL
jgi:hypothetical protein